MRGGADRVTVESALISTMPLRELIRALAPAAAAEVLAAADRLQYRDFLTVVLIIDQPELFPDNWIYIHEPGVKLGRIQNFKNWSPEMVPDQPQTLPRPRVLLLRRRRPLDDAGRGRCSRSARARSRRSACVDGGTVVDGMRRPDAEGVSGLRRGLRARHWR